MFLVLDCEVKLWLPSAKNMIAGPCGLHDVTNARVAMKGHLHYFSSKLVDYFCVSHCYFLRL